MCAPARVHFFLVLRKVASLEGKFKDVSEAIETEPIGFKMPPETVEELKPENWNEHVIMEQFKSQLDLERKQMENLVADTVIFKSTGFGNFTAIVCKIYCM